MLNLIIILIPYFHFIFRTEREKFRIHVLLQVTIITICETNRQI